LSVTIRCNANKTTPPKDLHADPIGNVSSSRLGGSYNLDDIAPFHSVVSSDGIVGLDPRQLRVLESISLEQFALLVRRQDLMLRHQLVLRDVHEQFGLLEVLDPKRVTHLLDGLLGKGRNVDP